MFNFKKTANPEKNNDSKEGRQEAATVKQLIPYDSMLRNGIVYLGHDQWSVVLQLSDVNYLIATEEHQVEILDRWAKFLNLFDSNMQVQVLVSNQTLRSVRVADEMSMRPTGDRFDDLRADFNQVVHDKLSAMSSNVITTKCVVITLTEHDAERAKLTLNRFALMAESNLNSIDGCKVHRLNRTELLAMLSRQYRPDQPFMFDETDFEEDRCSTKDYIAPWSIDLPDSGTLRLLNNGEETFHRTVWIRDYPPELSDRLVSKLASLKSCINVSIHFTPHSRGDGLEVVKRKVAEIDMQIVEERRRNIKQKLPADMISADLEDSKAQAAALRDELQHSTQHLIDSIIVIGVSAKSEQDLDQRIKDVQSIIRQESCTAETMTYMQLEGFAAELPLGSCPAPMRRTLTTNSAAILIPFTTQEIFNPKGIWYGVNARSGNCLSADRKQLMNQNGFILGQTGSGKSQAAKNEMFQRFLEDDESDLLIIDPEHEYTPLCRAFGGTEVEISASSSQRINPMDIVIDDNADGDPIRAKSVSVLSMLGSLVGGTDGLAAEAKGMLDRCILQLYRNKLNNPQAPQPTLHDLHGLLASVNDPLAYQLALQIEMYTEGSLSGFAGQTNVDLSNRFINFDVSGLDGELRTFGMMVVLDNVWNRVVANRKKGKRTWLWIDEFHRFFGNAYASKQFLDIYKRGRKYGLGVTGITQNIEELLANNEARLMLSNSDFLLMMNQFPTDAEELASLLKLSDEQRAFFSGVNAGQGLAKVGNSFIPIDGRIETDSKMYQLFTTKFGDNAFEALAS